MATSHDGIGISRLDSSYRRESRHASPLERDVPVAPVAPGCDDRHAGPSRLPYPLGRSAALRTERTSVLADTASSGSCKLGASGLKLEGYPCYPRDAFRFAWAAAPSFPAMPGTGSPGRSWLASSALLSSPSQGTAANVGSPSSASEASSLLTRPYRAAQSWFKQRAWSKEEVDTFLYDYRTIVTAGTASLVSTAASFPFDSVKSRLQVRDYPSIWECTKSVVREEGVRGFFRGVTIPLITISFVRTSSFSIYFNTKQWLHARGYLADNNRLTHTALSGMIGGATSGIIISCGSAPFELVKVQRQLEYLIAVQNGLVSKAGANGGRTFVPRSGFAAASNIFVNHGGPKGFYMGFPLHIMRDTMGTALYFGFYDTIRKLVSRYSTGDSRTGPQLFGLPGPVVSFLSGSSAGIASWLIVYPVDLIKTKVQRDALAGNPRQFTGWQVFLHMIRERPENGTDGSKRDTMLSRYLRLYRGLGVSALRSFISHGVTWTLIETISQKISERTGRPISYTPDAKREET